MGGLVLSISHQLFEIFCIFLTFVFGVLFLFVEASLRYIFVDFSLLLNFSVSYQRKICCLFMLQYLLLILFAKKK